MTFGPKPIPVLTRTNFVTILMLEKERVYCAVWPDLAKFRHLTMTLKNFGHFERVQIVFGKVLSLCTLANSICYWVNSLSWKWQNIKNNLAIWSHCYCLLPPLFRCRCCCWEPFSNLPKTLKISIKIEHSVGRRQRAASSVGNQIPFSKVLTCFKSFRLVKRNLSQSSGRVIKQFWLWSSVTRLCDLLDFGKFLKPIICPNLLNS